MHFFVAHVWKFSFATKLQNMVFPNVRKSGTLHTGNGFMNVLSQGEQKNMRGYRVLEMLPGIFSWGTLFGMVAFSWRLPVAASFFIIAFDLYWLLKTVFFVFHIHSS